MFEPSSEPGLGTHFQIPVRLMPQLAEARHKDDDWTGTTDAASRRKIQTRLNTRAYRKRRKAQLAAAKAGQRSGETQCTGTTSRQDDSGIPCWVERHRKVSLLPRSVAKKLLPAAGRPVIQPSATDPDPAVPEELILPLAPDHLIVLLQYNVLRACAANRDLLFESGLFKPDLIVNCNESVMHTLSTLTSAASLPPSLHPTDLQRTVPHDYWIDIMPHPLWRDNMIKAAGTYDDDDLWADTIGGLFDGFPGDEVERRGLVAWSPVWDPSGWEMSEGFMRKWGWLFEGFEHVALEATNRWRRQRGEEPLVWEVD